MIVREFYETRSDGVNLYRTYSDNDMMIEQETGVRYSEAIDIENSGHTYIETSEPIPSIEITDTQALNIIMGRGIPSSEPDNGNEIPEEN